MNIYGMTALFAHDRIISLREDKEAKELWHQISLLDRMVKDKEDKLDALSDAEKVKEAEIQQQLKEANDKADDISSKIEAGEEVPHSEFVDAFSRIHEKYEIMQRTSTAFEKLRNELFKQLKAVYKYREKVFNEVNGLRMRVDARGAEIAKLNVMADEYTKLSVEMFRETYSMDHV